MSPIKELTDDIPWPWCDSCLSYHHPRNPDCQRTQALEQGYTQSFGWRETVLGPVEYVRVRRRDDRPMGWRDIFEVFSRVYPGRWAAQFFPPADSLIDEGNVYHLFVFPKAFSPKGININPCWRLMSDE